VGKLVREARQGPRSQLTSKMVKLSDSLMWQLTKSHNCFTVKSHGTTLTHEPFNLLNKPSPKYSGLANSKAVGIIADTATGNSVMVLKTKAAEDKPKKSAHKVALRTHGKGTRRLNQTVKKVVGDQFYAPALTTVALERLTKQAKAANRKTNGVKYVPKKRSNKN